MKTQRAVLLLAFYLGVELACIRATLFVEQTRADLALAVCICILITLACIADSKVIGKPMAHAAKWVMPFIWPIAAPIYLLWSRGWRGFIPLLVHLVIFCVLWIGTAFVVLGLLEIEPR